VRIARLRARDVRFPTSRELDGSDALNTGDYSATYVTLETDGPLVGHGLTFTHFLPQTRQLRVEPVPRAFGGVQVAVTSDRAGVELAGFADERAQCHETVPLDGVHGVDGEVALVLNAGRVVGPDGVRRLDAPSALDRREAPMPPLDDEPSCRVQEVVA